MNYDIAVNAATVLSYQTLVVGARFIAAAGLSYLIFWKLGKDRFAKYKIQPVHSTSKVATEVRWSAVTIVIFALAVILANELYALGITKIYLNVEERGWFYFFFSTLAMLIMHDTYLYWTHRWMHIPKVFKRVHRVHHLSKDPTPWGSYSFHPTEAVIQAGILPLIVLTLPVHPAALISFLLLDLAINILGHLGYEFFPKNLMKGPGGILFNTTTHHNMHHQYVNSNFGLYFNVWDRLLSTNHSQYIQNYEKVVSRRTLTKN